MTDSKNSSADGPWLKPPAANEANIYIRVGKDARLTPEVMAELRKLALLLEQAPSVEKQMNCPDVHIMECKIFVNCKEVTFPS